MIAAKAGRSSARQGRTIRRAVSRPNKLFLVLLRFLLLFARVHAFSHDVLLRRSWQLAVGGWQEWFHCQPLTANHQLNRTSGPQHAGTLVDLRIDEHGDQRRIEQPFVHLHAQDVERALDILRMEMNERLLDPSLVAVFIDAKVYERAGVLRT